MNAEKRKNTRVPFQATITARFPDKIYERHETQDLSLKGVFVNNVTGRNVGDRCELSLHLSGATSDLSLNMTGEVMQVRDDGVGLRFSKIDLDSFYHLKNIIYFNSKNPDALEDELNSERIPRSLLRG